MTAAEISSAQDDDPEIIEKEKADYQFYLSYDFNPIDNIWFHGPHIPIRTGKVQKIWINSPIFHGILYFLQWKKDTSCTHHN